MKSYNSLIRNKRLYSLLLIVLLIIPYNTFAWKFIAYGDTRSDDENHRAVLQSIVNNTPDYEFILSVGDLVRKGIDSTHWDMWRNAVTDILGSTGQEGEQRYYVAPGNHEAIKKGGLENWKKYLYGQYNDYKNTNGLSFYFDHKNVRVIIIDCYGDTESQIALIHEATNNNPNSWLFAVWHMPIFVFGNKEYKEKLNQKLGTILYNAGCDIIFVGHSHMYVRTKKLELNGDKYPPLDEENGTVQLLTGNGGVELENDVLLNDDGNEYMVAENAYSKNFTQYGYTELEVVDNDTLILKHILHDGLVLDSTTYSPNKKANHKQVTVSAD